MAAQQDLASVALDVVPRLARLVTQVLVSEVAEDVTVRQYRVLARLVAGGQADIGALAARSGVRQPTMSQTIDGLVDRGWATRTENPEDRRRRSIEITPAGRAVADRAGAALAKGLTDLFAGISTTERNALQRGLTAVQQQLDERWGHLVAHADV